MKNSLTLIMCILALACTKTNEEDNKTPGLTPTDNTETPQDCNIQGFAQKGQFVKGSQVTAFAVGEDLVATGESFPANISDDLGAFGITGKTNAPYLELRAEGYYYNELEGAISQNPLYLEAFVKSDDDKANINLLTTAIRPRVKKLIKEGMTYDEAVVQSQSELLKAVGFVGQSADFDEMDITGTSEADGMLLAFACMIQSGRSASEVTTLVQEIASDIEAKGELSASVFDKVKSKVNDVRPFRVYANLAGYYHEKDLPVSTVPSFHKYLDKQYDNPFILLDENIISYGSDPLELYADYSQQIEGRLYVLSTVNFTVETDLEGATAVKEQVIGPAYQITVHIPANTDLEPRTVNVIFKDPSGEVLAVKELAQDGDVQYIFFRIGTQTKADFGPDDEEQNPFSEGAIVSVNGIECTIQRYDAINGKPGVAVHKADYYQISYPANAVVINTEQPLYGSIMPELTVDTHCTSGDSMQYFGYCKPERDALSSPVEANMWPALPLVQVNLDATLASEWGCLELTPNASNEYVAGTVMYTVNEEEFQFFGFQNAEISYGTDMNETIRVDSSEPSESILFSTIPQTFSEGFTVTLYDKSGTKIADKKISSRRLFLPGRKYSIGTLTAPNPDNKPHWLELPAYQEDDNHCTLIHDMQGGLYKSSSYSGVRNWTGFWDRNEHLCYWVAYPLNQGLRGSGSRTNQWGLDPLLPASEQPDLTSGSYGGGWTRGHQIPSADRLEYAPNVSTFYGTNMTPQQYDFNGGIWANLENAVRNYAVQSDTLYVVTGCLVENSTSYSGYNSGFRVKVPTHYYKALLSKNGKNYKAIGFLMPHSADIANDDYWDYRMTIDELEEQTGIDFFPNLKAVLGESPAEDIERVIGSWQ